MAADYTDTLTYSVQMEDGTTFSDTITETVSSVTECLHYKVKAGTGVGDVIFSTDGVGQSGPFELDPNYILIINRDQTQDCEIEMEGSSDRVHYQLPPNGFIKFTFDGSGTYKIETQNSSTQSAWDDLDTITAAFVYNEGEIEVIAVEI